MRITLNYHVHTVIYGAHGIIMCQLYYHVPTILSCAHCTIMFIRYYYNLVLASSLILWMPDAWGELIPQWAKTAACNITAIAVLGYVVESIVVM